MDYVLLGSYHMGIHQQMHLRLRDAMSHLNYAAQYHTITLHVKTKGQEHMDLIYLDLKKMVGGWKRWWSETTQEERRRIS